MKASLLAILIGFSPTVLAQEFKELHQELSELNSSILPAASLGEKFQGTLNGFDQRSCEVETSNDEGEQFKRDQFLLRSFSDHFLNNLEDPQTSFEKNLLTLASKIKKADFYEVEGKSFKYPGADEADFQIAALMIKAQINRYYETMIYHRQSIQVGKPLIDEVVVEASGQDNLCANGPVDCKSNSAFNTWSIAEGLLSNDPAIPVRTASLYAIREANQRIVAFYKYKKCRNLVESEQVLKNAEKLSSEMTPIKKDSGEYIGACEIGKECPFAQSNAFLQASFKLYVVDEENKDVQTVFTKFKEIHGAKPSASQTLQYVGLIEGGVSDQELIKKIQIEKVVSLSEKNSQRELSSLHSRTPASDSKPLSAFEAMSRSIE